MVGAFWALDIAPTLDVLVLLRLYIYADSLIIVRIIWIIIYSAPW